MPFLAENDGNLMEGFLHSIVANRVRPLNVVNTTRTRCDAAHRPPMWIWLPYSEILDGLRHCDIALSFSL